MARQSVRSPEAHLRRADRVLWGGHRCGGTRGRRPSDAGEVPRRRSGGTASGGRSVQSQSGVPAFARRAHRLRGARTGAVARPARRRGGRTAGSREGHRGVDRRHLPDVPPAPARCAAGRRHRPPACRGEGVRTAGVAGPRRTREDRGAVAPLADAGLYVSLAHGTVHAPGPGVPHALRTAKTAQTRPRAPSRRTTTRAMSSCSAPPTYSRTSSASRRTRHPGARSAQSMARSASG